MTTKTGYISDTDRRSLIGELLQTPSKGGVEKVLQEISNLGTCIKDPKTSPIEKRLQRIYINTNAVSDMVDDGLLFSQTRAPLYEQLAHTIVEGIKHVDPNHVIVDNRLKTFVLNNLFSGSFTTKNMPMPIIKALEPYCNNTVVQNLLNERVNSLDKTTLDLTSQIAGTPYIRYNMYQFVADHLEIVTSLAETNPAIMTLFLYTADLETPTIEHQGDVVRSVKEDLLEKHSDTPQNTYWKALSKRSHRSIYNHLVCCSQHGLNYASPLTTELLIASTKINVELVPTANSWLEALSDSSFQELQQRGLILNLLLKETTKHEPDDEWFMPANLRRQIQEITDYARNMNPDATITSTSWNGLLERCDQWHREQRTTRNIRSHDPHKMHVWNSLIEEPIEEDGYRITPLVNSIQLYLESDEVEHCVRSYVNTCTGGRSRIFKIRPADKEYDRSRVGTTEIALSGNTWEVRQTRGIRNHTPPASMDKAARRIAALYTELWTKAKPKNDNKERHYSWVEERTDDQPKGNPSI